jgi:fatty-acyl-CoA synthase
MNRSLQARLYKRLEKEADRRAITFYNQRGEYSWYSVEQFYKKAAARAAQLADQGLRKGDICILVLPSDESCATLLLGSLFVGAVPLLIAPPVLQGAGAFSSLTQIIKRITRKTKPRLVVCEESMTSMRSELEAVRKDTRFLFGEKEFSAVSSADLRMASPDETDIAAMQLTSGTTGFPRVCVWKQKSILAALDGMAAAMKLSKEDVCLNWTPLYHDMGFVNNFFLCLTHGVPLVMLDPKDFVKSPALWLRALHETRATTTWSPNFGFAITAQRVKDKEIEAVDLSAVRAFWNAAERIHFESMQAFYERFAPIGVRFEALNTNFGCAENIGGATFSDPEGSLVVEHVDRTTFQKKRIAQPVSDPKGNGNIISIVGVGRPHPNINIQILSKTGRSLPEGHVGEIALETPSRMSGYLGDARATRRALYGDLLRTGDLGYLRNGELFWVGRVRERITIRGKKLDPSDFEPILTEIPDLRHGSFAAFGIDESELGTQRIVVVSEVRESAGRTPFEIVGDIRGLSTQRLGITVSDVLLVRPGTLTKTSSGKRRHRYFRKLYLEGKLKEFKWGPHDGKPLRD